MSKTILCLASCFKGSDFIRTCKAEGHEVVLVINESIADNPWPWDSIEEHVTMPDLNIQPDILYKVSYLAREYHFDAVVALDADNLRVAASLREHLHIADMGEAMVPYFQDGLAMRMKARLEKLPLPSFVHVLNYDRLEDYIAWVSPPWLLKPRFETTSVGAKKIDHSQQLWQTLDDIGDTQSFYLLEQLIPGEVYQVDAITVNHKVIFAVAHRQNRSLINLTTAEGVFVTHTMLHNSAETLDLLEVNEQLIKAFELRQGVTHAKFLKGQDGEIYVLEVVARVGGVEAGQVVEAATGVNLWAEWAKLELAYLEQRPYHPPVWKKGHAGLALCFAKQTQPDLSAYDDSEIVARLEGKPHQAGLIVASSAYDRVQTLLDSYMERFTHDFLAE